MTRIRQITEVISTRQQEDRKARLQYKEIEVQAVVSAIHAAAGNRKGAAAAQKFRFHKPAPAVISTGTAARLFPGEALYSQEDILARAAELEAAA
jgi:hypothetical protein